MISRYRPFFVVLAALIMLLVLGGVAFADGPTTTVVPAPSTAAKTTACVDGYVINHREQPVDGTKFNPQLSIIATSAADTGVQLTALVDSKGYFKFKELTLGDWSFSMQLPEGWEGIAPAAENGGVAQMSAATLKEQSTCYRIVFKIRRIIGVSIVKYEELLDGTIRPGVDWEITATPVDDPWAVAKSDKTGADGRTGFDLTPGKWVIAEKVKSGWVPVTPSSVTITLDQYSPVGAREPIVFKNRQPACYGKIVVTKTGVGTVKEDGKPVDFRLGMLAGWNFTLSRADGKMTPITKTTGADGTATFDKLVPGVYKVTETVLPGWTATTSSPQTVILGGCDTATVSFVNKENIGKMRIYGHKYFKAWVKPYQGTLVGLAGWQITATLVGATDFVATTTTNALGEYEFSQDTLTAAGIAFPGASVQVCEEVRKHWIAQTPTCVTVTFPYPLPPDYNGAKVDFTNVQDPPLPGASTATSTNTASGCSATVVVKSGDTLAKIAGRYSVSARTLMRTNAIRNPDVIYLGQRICVP